MQSSCSIILAAIDGATVAASHAWRAATELERCKSLMLEAIGEAARNVPR